MSGSSGVLFRFAGDPHTVGRLSELVRDALNDGRRIGLFTAPVDFRTAPLETLAVSEFVVGLDRPAIRTDFSGLLFVLSMWKVFRASFQARRSLQNPLGHDNVSVPTEFTREDAERLYAPLRRSPGAMN